MQNNFQAYEMINDNIKKTLKDYEKIITVREEEEVEDTEYLIDRVKNKINTIQEIKKTRARGNSIISKYNHTLDVIENPLYEDFRLYNDYIPKINISQAVNSKKSPTNTTDFYHLKEGKSFKPKHNTLNIEDFKNSKKIEAAQNYNPDPFFLSNKYYEVKYRDISEKSKMKENLNFNLLIRNKNTALNLVSMPSENTPLFEKYSELIIEEEKARRHEISYNDRLKDDDSFFEGRDEIEEIDKKKKETQILVNGKNSKLSEFSSDYKKVFSENMNKYHSWVMGLFNNSSKNSSYNKISLNKGKQNIDSFGSIVTETGLKIIINSKERFEESNDSISYDAKSISFGISLSGLIDKVIKNTQNMHKRGIYLEGPIVTWTRSKGGLDTNKQKGWFDVRKINNYKPSDKSDKTKKGEKSQDSNIKLPKEEDFFTVKTFYKGIKPYPEKDKKEKRENKEDSCPQLKFTSNKLEELANKSYPEILQQIKNYYSQLFANSADKDDYSIKKYLSDPYATYLIQQGSAKRKDLIDNLTWHHNIVKLELKAIDKSGLNKFFSLLGENCVLLQSLTLEAPPSNNTFDFEANGIKSYFTNNLYLADIHFINYKFEDISNLTNLLMGKVERIVKGTQTFSKFSHDLPYKNITISRRIDSNNSNNKLNISNGIIDLEDLYIFFKRMADKFGGIENFKSPFGKLDISNYEVIKIGGLVKIINKFKIIRELNISNTFLTNKNNNKLTEELLVNNRNFLQLLSFKSDLPSKRNLITKEDDNLFFDYSNNILPLLESIYLIETSVTKETFVELLNLFKVRIICNL